MLLQSKNKPTRLKVQNKNNASATINAIIIEDEKNSMLFLKGILEKNCPQINIIGKLGSIKEAIRFFINNKLTIDIAFLDIEMPDGTIFQLLEQLEDISFHIIFTTAHNDYAEQAFRYSALDYFLKPLDPEDIVKAVDKLLQSKPDNIIKQLEVFREHYDSPNAFEKIILKGNKGMHFVYIKDIIRCMGSNCYTYFYFKDNSKVIISKTLLTYEKLLKKANFHRIHRSHLINLNFIKHYNNGKVILEDDTILTVSRRRKKAFEKVLNDLS